MLVTCLKENSFLMCVLTEKRNFRSQVRVDSQGPSAYATPCRLLCSFIEDQSLLTPVFPNFSCIIEEIEARYNDSGSCMD